MPHVETFDNGLTLILEPMQNLESVAYELQIPGGVVLDREDRVGASIILSELSSRGAGDLNSRALSDAFEERGIRHAESTGNDRFSYRGVLLSDFLGEALRLVSLMVQRPILPEDEIAPIQSVLIQDIDSIPDEPSRQVMVELSGSYYPAPHNRQSHGSRDGIAATTVAELRELWQGSYVPRGSVLSLAGNIEITQARELALRYFSDWRGAARTLPVWGPMPEHRQSHVVAESAQVQLALAYSSAKFGDVDYYTSKVATGVLSGGMFGRLFIEVREKRGLCYSVSARHSGTKDYGTVLVYAGTTPDRAAETLAVMIAELPRLRGTVTQAELDRARANLLTGLIMSEESSGSRASSNAGDWWVAGRVRTLEEIKAGIDAVTRADIDRYVERFPSVPFSLVSLGPKAVV